MMRFVSFILIAALMMIGSGCSKQPSAIEQLKKKQSDPLAKMVLPPKPDSEDKYQHPVSDGVEATQPDEPAVEGPDLSAFPSIQESTIERLVMVNKDKVPLYKGPGAEYRKLGSAYRGQKFKWLRTVDGSDGTSWHIIKDRKGESFFISTDDSSTVESESRRGSIQVSSGKVVLQKMDSSDVVQSQGMFDPTPPLPQELIQANHLTLNFEQTDIYEVITTFCELLKINYIIEGQIKGKITLQTFRKIPTKDLYSIFEQILAVNGITVVKSGDFYRFIPIKDSSKKPLNLHYGTKPEVPSRSPRSWRLWIPTKLRPPILNSTPSSTLTVKRWWRS